MKQLYERTSTTTTAAGLDTTLRDAINEHATANQLGDVLAEARTVCVTRSVRLYRNGLLAKVTGSGDPDREHRTAALLSPRYLVIAIAGEKRGVHVRSARLDGISLNPGIVLNADSGISVVAQWSGAIANQALAGFYLGLGNDEAGHAFLSSFRDAVATAKAR